VTQITDQTSRRLAQTASGGKLHKGQ